MNCAFFFYVYLCYFYISIYLFGPFLLFLHIPSLLMHIETQSLCLSVGFGVKESICDVIQGLARPEMSDLQDNLSLIAKFV